MIALVVLAALAATPPKLPYFDRAVCAPLDPLPRVLDEPALQAVLIELEPMVRECVVRVAPHPVQVALTATGANVPAAAGDCVKRVLQARFQGVQLPAASVVDELTIDDHAELDGDGLRAAQLDWCDCYRDVTPGVLQVSFRASDAAGPERVAPYFVSVTERGKHLGCLEKRIAAQKLAPTGERQFALRILDSGDPRVPGDLPADAQFESQMLQAHRLLASVYRRESARLQAFHALADRVNAYDLRVASPKDSAEPQPFRAQLAEVESGCRALLDADDAEFASLRNLASLADAARALADRQSRGDPTWLPTLSAVRAQRAQLRTESSAARAARDDDAQFCASVHALAGQPLQVRSERRRTRPAWDVPHPPDDPAHKQLEDELRRELERAP